MALAKLLEAKTIDGLTQALADLTGYRTGVKWQKAGYTTYQVEDHISTEHLILLSRYGTLVEPGFRTHWHVTRGDDTRFTEITLRNPDNLALKITADKIASMSHEERMVALKQFTDSQGVECKWTIEVTDTTYYRCTPMNCDKCRRPGKQGNYDTCDSCKNKMDALFHKLMELMEMFGCAVNCYVTIYRSNTPFYLRMFAPK